MINELIQCDCMEYMKTCKDKQFDLAIVDPPYGIGEDGSKTQSRRVSCKKWKNPSASKYKNGGWDKEPPKKEYFNELFRISKNQIIWGANHFISRIPFDSSCWIVWKKNGSCEGADFADCELAWTSFKTAVRFFEFSWTGFGAVNAKETRIHPTQKPVALYKWLLKNYAHVGEKLLDTHSGSGSFRIATYDMGFDLISCEKDHDYCIDNETRFQAHIAQQELIPIQEIQQLTFGAV
jgi:site-specific DNA-methyltransferase (adenine-specific)